MLTEGASGGRYATEEGREGRYEPAPVPGPIADTYGSGDSFQAGLTWALGEGMDPEDAIDRGLMRGRGPDGPRPRLGPAHRLRLWRMPASYASILPVVAHSRSSSRNAWISAIVVGPNAAFVPGSVRRSSSSSRRVNAHVSCWARRRRAPPR